MQVLCVLAFYNLMKTPSSSMDGDSEPRHSCGRKVASFHSVHRRKNSWSSTSGSSCADIYYLSSADLHTALELTEGPRHISQAKAILAEATTSYPVAVPPSCSRQQPIGKAQNSGAVAPLLVMLRTCGDPKKLGAALSTLGLLLLDPANCKSVIELDGMVSVLEAASKVADHPHLLAAVLKALSTMCRHSEQTKRLLWRHPSKDLLLGLLSPHLSSSALITTLRAFLGLAFNGSRARSSGCGASAAAATMAASISPTMLSCLSTSSSRQPRAPVLLERGVLTAVAGLLHPGADEEVLLAAMEVLSRAAQAPNSDHLAGWHQVAFKMVPLLQPGVNGLPPAVIDSALGVLLTLSDHTAFLNVLYAAGCINPLLSFLTPRGGILGSSVACAACVLGTLSEGGLSRDRLCQEGCVAALVQALQHPCSAEVVIGVLYVLGRLASYRPVLAGSLRQRGVVPILQSLLQTSGDEDVELGASRLLQFLGAPPVPVVPAPSLMRACQQRPTDCRSVPLPSLALSAVSTAPPQLGRSSMPRQHEGQAGRDHGSTSSARSVCCAELAHNSAAASAAAAAAVVSLDLRRLSSSSSASTPASTSRFPQQYHRHPSQQQLHLLNATVCR